MIDLLPAIQIDNEADALLERWDTDEEADDYEPGRLSRNLGQTAPNPADGAPPGSATSAGLGDAPRRSWCCPTRRTRCSRPVLSERRELDEYVSFTQTISFVVPTRRDRRRPRPRRRRCRPVRMPVALAAAADAARAAAHGPAAPSPPSPPRAHGRRRRRRRRPRRRRHRLGRRRIPGGPTVRLPDVAPLAAALRRAPPPPPHPAARLALAVPTAPAAAAAAAAAGTTLRVTPFDDRTTPALRHHLVQSRRHPRRRRRRRRVQPLHRRLRLQRLWHALQPRPPPPRPAHRRRHRPFCRRPPPARVRRRPPPPGAPPPPLLPPSPPTPPPRPPPSLCRRCDRLPERRSRNLDCFNRQTSGCSMDMNVECTLYGFCNVSALETCQSQQY